MLQDGGADSEFADRQVEATPDGIVGAWIGDGPPAFAAAELVAAIHDVRNTAFVVVDPATGRRGIARGGAMVEASRPGAFPVLAVLPAMYPEWLGDRSFNEAHATRFPYVTGAMANGIATTRLVIEAARAGCLGFFGAAGLQRDAVRVAIDEPVQTIVESVVKCLSQAPPELAQDLIVQGVHLVGGGAMLKGLDARLRRETGVPVHMVDAPLEAVVLGAGRCIEDFDNNSIMFMDER